jgi:glycerol-3-phosphate acyltransferase PlsY
MTDETGTNEPGKNEAEKDQAQPARSELLPLPGLAAISLYLLVLATVIVVGVVGGRHYPPLFLLFAAGFIAASAGLLRLLRWAWALALSAVFLLTVYNLWIFSSQHQIPALVQGLLNLVFFLYLVRPEVRERLW